MDRKKKYEKKRVNRLISFRVERESELLEFSKTFNFSRWVKAELEKKMRGSDEN